MIGHLLAMGFPAAEVTPQILTPGVPGVSEKEEAAMATSRSPSAQRRVGFGQRSQEPVVLQHQRPDHRVGAVPVGCEFKVLLDLDCKKPKTSLTMLT